MTGSGSAPERGKGSEEMPLLPVLRLVVANRLVFAPSVENTGVSVVCASAGVKVGVSAVGDLVAVKADDDDDDG